MTDDLPFRSPRAGTIDPMVGRLFTLLSALSLLLCIGTSMLWVRSYWVADWVERRHSKSGATDWSQAALGARSSRGLFRVVLVRQRITNPRMVAAVRDLPIPPIPLHGTNSPDDPLWRRRPQSFANRLSFYWGTRDASAFSLLDGEEWEAALPHWAAAGLAAVGPCYWCWRFRPKRKPGHCPRCGYDLRATPGRCPECGTVPQACKPGIFLCAPSDPL
jgi:hypothetical protein